MSKARLSVALLASRRAVLLLALLHLGALVAPLLVDIPLWSQALLVTSVLSSGAYGICAHALRCLPSSITMLHCDANDNWRLEWRGGQTHAAVLLTGACVHPLMTVMCFRLADGKLVSLLILTDALDSDQFRRLRARVRYALTNR